MHERLLGLAATALLFAGPWHTPAAGAQDTPAYDRALADAGAHLFREHCASCHGPRGKGDGAVAGRLNFAPPDLTTLHRRTRGGFSLENARRIVDGRRPLEGHGGPEMPVWGDAFRNSDYGYSEEAVRLKITRLVHYLASIQDSTKRP